MTDDEVRRIQKRAKYVAKKFGYPELAEDFAQEVFISILRGWRQPIDHAFVDFLRGTGGFGSSRSLDGLAKQAGVARSISLDAPLGDEGGDQCLHHDVVAAPENDRGRDEDGPDFGPLFRGRQATIYQLYFVQEFSEFEIGEILGVSESRVSQLLKPMKATIQNSALMQRLDQESDFGVFRVDWITL